MKYSIKYSFLFIVLTICIFLFSCNDDWNNYYNNAVSSSDANLYELIKQNSQISKFAKLIEISGYDKILSASQAYTVWAPDNESLSSVDTNTIDSVQARLIVENQIARFNNPTSVPSGKSIRMMNKKIYSYSDDGGISFGGKLLIEKNIIANNGLLQITNGLIPYFSNLYEFITTNENTSSIADFISQFQEKLFDEALSIPIDNENGMIIYDSITTPYNRLFEYPRLGLGSINNEDSIYTMLVPTNAAWKTAYERIAPYFKVYNKNQLYADSVSNVQTSLAIVNNLIFRGRIPDPYAVDSLISTYTTFMYYNLGQKTVIHEVKDLFGGSEKTTASNGLIYLTGNLNLDNVGTWNPPIVIEAENTNGRVTGSNTTISSRIVTIGSPIQDVSGGRYIFIEPTNSSSQASVTFSIPDVLSCKYNIYIDLLPSIDDNNVFSNDSTMLAFNLSYMGSDGTLKTATASNSPEYTTSGTQKVRMEIFSEFEFPVSNYVDQLWYMNPQNKPENLVATTTLTIRTNVTTQQVTSTLYTRRFSIDAIIFEPIQNKVN